ncbi:helix-turn-helix domain-containing protein [Nocardioides sp. LHG3406-4]|uniref:arsenate reductase/protein-tyrosine-phosphatase family protein n=1 Tax=Nocardioides sp. LHG3406-4 TaxID=2804575 RepID=UPI003CEE6D41
MNTERTDELERRAAVHAALGDPARLRIVDTLLLGDASPSELATQLGMPSNLLAHHLNVLESADVVSRHRSEGDRRRTYLRLTGVALDQRTSTHLTPNRVVFVCTANSARSHLASALWRQVSPIPSISAGTHPADRIDPAAIEVAHRHDLPLPRVRPRHLDDVVADDDLVVSVCDLAHEELGRRSQLHWSIPDPVRIGTAPAFDTAYEEIEHRVAELASRFPVAS